MKISLAVLTLTLLCACSPPSASVGAPVPVRDALGFPAADRPIAGIVSPEWSSGPDRDAADESGQLIRALGIRPGMVMADIGAGSGYHTLRLSPAVGPQGLIYAEDIVEAYVAGLRREVERRKFVNVRIVIGAADDPRLPPAKIDRAVLVHMYHEIESPYGLLWNLAGSMKPGGLVGVIDLDRKIENHGTPPALLKCEFEAVGYRRISQVEMAGGTGYIAVFEAPRFRPKPTAIIPCEARRPLRLPFGTAR